VNLGEHYRHKTPVANIPLLLHELTHIWQIDHSVRTEVVVCEGLLQGLLDTVGEDVYSFEPGLQWPDYGLEQQASIVEAWSRGATRLRAKVYDVSARPICALSSPVFRYINGNIRRGRTRAETGAGNSVRQLLADGGHQTPRQMHPPRTGISWNPAIF
jgi:hypothetical protein